MMDISSNGARAASVPPLATPPSNPTAHPAPPPHRPRTATAPPPRRHRTAVPPLPTATFYLDRPPQAPASTTRRSAGTWSASSATGTASRSPSCRPRATAPPSTRASSSAPPPVETKRPGRDPALREASGAVPAGQRLPSNAQPLCRNQAGSAVGQPALRRPLSAPEQAPGCPELRPASAKQSVGPRWPTASGPSYRACFRHRRRPQRGPERPQHGALQAQPGERRAGRRAGAPGESSGGNAQSPPRFHARGPHGCPGAVPCSRRELGRCAAEEASFFFYLASRRAATRGATRRGRPGETSRTVAPMP